MDAATAMKYTVMEVDNNLMNLPTAAETSNIISEEADKIMNITRSLMKRLYHPAPWVIT